MQSIALVIHVALSIAVIGLVLIQHGKGADAGAAFGSGASSTVFGARGATSFLTRITTILAGCFFATSIALFYMAANRDGVNRSVTDGLQIEAPAADTPAADLPPVDGASDGDAPAADLPSVEGASDGDSPAADLPPVDGASDGDASAADSAPVEGDGDVPAAPAADENTDLPAEPAE